MQRHIYRLIAMLLLFIGASAFFIMRMDETVSTKVTGTTDMSEASFPLVSMSINGQKLNWLHGYQSDTERLPREEITPVKDPSKIDIFIRPFDNSVKQVSFEITDRSDDTVTNSGDGSIGTADEDGDIPVSLLLTEPVTKENDFGLQIMVVNSTGRKVYFYTTLRYQQSEHLLDNLKFVQKFEEAEYSGKDESSIRPYIETDSSMDNASLSHVNIHSSYDNIIFNRIEPQKITDTKITVLENNDDTSAFLFTSIVSAGKKDVRTFKVREYYRVQHAANTTYLLSFDRTMEEFFEPEYASLSASQLLLGVSAADSLGLTTSPDGNLIAFVKNNELWYYSSSENKAVRVFSFSGGSFDDDRLNHDEHSIQILGMDDAGNIDFTVFGYMNRGVYEGRNGIVLYRYYHKENRVEEQVYIPVSGSYQMLREDLDSFSYVSGESFYYFEINGTIYSYSLIKKKLTTIAEGLTDSTFLYLKGAHSIVWQESEDVKSDKLTVMDLETRKLSYINAEKNRVILLFGGIEGNMIYGTANVKNIITNPDGSTTLPCTKLSIADVHGNVLKKYFRKNKYVTEVRINDSVISLTRVKKVDGEFKHTSSDQILNNVKEKEKAVRVVTRVTSSYLTQYMITLHYGVVLQTEPKVEDPPKMTIISEDVTLRLPEEKNAPKKYYACVAGQITASSVEAGEIIGIANEGMGFVIDSDAATVWERGVKPVSASCDEVDTDYATSTDTPVQGAVRLFLTSKGVYLSDKELYNAKGDIMDILAAEEYVSSVNLTGASLDEVLYYVAGNTPVIAFTGSEDAVLITGYTSGDITIMHGATAKTENISYDTAEKMFADAGNVFISSTE